MHRIDHTSRFPLSPRERAGVRASRWTAAFDLTADPRLPESDLRLSQKGWLIGKAGRKAVRHLRRSLDAPNRSPHARSASRNCRDCSVEQAGYTHVLALHDLDSRGLDANRL